jgi:hypothetical protein
MVIQGGSFYFNLNAAYRKVLAIFKGLYTIQVTIINRYWDSEKYPQVQYKRYAKIHCVVATSASR